MPKVSYFRGLAGDAEIIDGKFIEIQLGAEETGQFLTRKVFGFSLEELPEQELSEGGNLEDLEEEYSALAREYGREAEKLIGAEPEYTEERRMGEIVERHNQYSATLKHD